MNRLCGTNGCQCGGRCRGGMGYYVLPQRRVRARGTRVGLRGLGGGECSQAGQQLLYKVNWPPAGVVMNTPADIMQIVISAISNQGLRAISSVATSEVFYSTNPGFTLTVLDLTGHADCDDVRKIIDGAVYNAGRKPISTIALIQQMPTATVPPGGQPKPPFDFGAWLSDNWIYVALGLGAAVVVEEL